MGPNRKIKAPKVYQGTPGKEKRYARSSTKAPKPQGVQPNAPAYGVLHGGNQSNEANVARADRLFGTSRATPSGQSRISSKAKRQVG